MNIPLTLLVDVELPLLLFLSSSDFFQKEKYIFIFLAFFFKKKTFWRPFWFWSIILSIVAVGPRFQFENGNFLGYCQKRFRF
jgi:hypothetical protein